MEHAATTKGSRCARSDESVPYPAHKVGYQRFRETFGAKVSRLSAQKYIQEEMEFLDISYLTAAY